MHKVRTTIKFKSLEEYQTMKTQLDSAGINFDAFVNYSLDYTWNEMLKEYSKQMQEAKEAVSEPSDNEPAGDSK